MITPAHPRALPALRYCARSASLAVMAFGCLGLAGWLLEIDALKNVLQHLPLMVPNTAVAFVVAGISLWMLGSTAPTALKRRAAQISAFAVAVLGALTLAEYLFGWDAGIDGLLLSESVSRLHVFLPGRPAFLTALNFLFLGVALLLLTVKSGSRRHPGELLSVSAILVSLLALIGYALNVPFFYGWRSLFPQTGMALHTSVAFIFLGIGVLCARPDGGLMQIIRSPMAGGRMARRLLLAPVIIPLATGGLRIAGQWSGLYNAELDSWLFAFLNVFIFTIVIWWSASSLHRSDAARKRTEEELERFFTLSLDILCIAGSDGYFKRLNPAFNQTLGYTDDELVSRPFLDFVHPDDLPATLAEMKKLSLGQSTLQFENRYLCKDGSWKWLSWKVRPFPSEGVLYATARDITGHKATGAAIEELNAELQHRATQLEEANKELESFSYSVSHDLRAPLRHIHGYVEMVQKTTNGQLSEKSQRYLDTIAAASAEMGQLIDDLLAFSRMGRARVHESQIELNGLVEDSIRGLEMETRGRNITWKIAPLPEVLGDRAMLKQVFTNLIGNAVKYSRQRTAAEIEVGCAAAEEGVAAERRAVLFVRDNGAGFDMQYAHKLFGVFQRLHRADEFEGTGIGLATVNRIVARHGGRAWAEGAIDQGATFYFTLKAATPAGQSSQS